MENITIVSFLNKVNRVILNPLITLAFAISFVLFAYGVVRFLSYEPGNKARDEARSSIIWGIVGMVIMFSVYGIIRFVMATFGISDADLATGKTFLQ